MLSEPHVTHEPAPARVPVRALLLAFVAIALLMAVDLATDFHHGGSLSHLLGEAVIMLVASWGAGLLLRDRRRALRRAARLSQRVAAAEAQAATLRAQNEQWRSESERFVSGLRAAIDAQFGRWALTAAEAEVALLLLKGLSLKEVADARDTSERTARQQSLAVYRKAGLSGRAELSAYFLEDLF